MGGNDWMRREARVWVVAAIILAIYIMVVIL